MRNIKTEREKIMCKLKSAKIGPPASISLSALVALSMCLLSMEKGQAQICLAANGGGIGIVDSTGHSLGGVTTPVRIGDVITINRFFVVNTSISFETRDVTVNVIKPNGNDSPVLHVDDIPGGINCVASGGDFGALCQNGVLQAPPGFSLANGATCMPFDPNYTVTFADIALSHTFTQCNNQNPPLGFILFRLRGSGTAIDSTGGNAGSAGICADVFVPVIFPCITITKVCDLDCTPFGSPISFHGTVCNTGDSLLRNVTVTDSPTATIVLAGTTSTGRTYDGNLNPGEGVNYTGSYQPAGSGAQLCGPFTDTITATATDTSGRSVTNTDPCINPTTGESTG